MVNAIKQMTHAHLCQKNQLSMKCKSLVCLNQKAPDKRVSRQIICLRNKGN